MPRKRLDAPVAPHHIIIRGIERSPIFKGSRDYENFLTRLGSILTETATTCYAWALLTNHIHLLLRTGTTPITTVMRRLLTGYAQQYNRRHNRQTGVTVWIEAKANEFLDAGLQGVNRIPYEKALHASTTRRHDYLNAYVSDLGNVIDMDAIRDAKICLGVDPLGGAGVHYWGPIAERYGLNLTVVNESVEWCVMLTFGAGLSAHAFLFRNK